MFKPIVKVNGNKLTVVDHIINGIWLCFKPIIYFFKFIGWLLDKFNKWLDQRPLSQKIRHAKIWLSFYFYLAIHRWIPPEYSKWAPYIVPSEPTENLTIQIVTTILWILILAGFINRYRKLTIIEVTREPWVGLLIQVQNEYFKVVSYKPGTTTWKVKVKKASKKEALVAEIMGS